MLFAHMRSKGSESGSTQTASISRSRTSSRRAGMWESSEVKSGAPTSMYAAAPNLRLTSLVHTVHSNSLVTKPSPLALAKGVKNESELEGMRAAHVRDGVAMVLALSRLERDVAAGQVITEVDVDERTTTARAQQAKFVGKRSLSGSGPSQRMTQTSTVVLASQCPKPQISSLLCAR